jgi:ribosomal protein S18 acetylase RimI-like enzyme
MAVAKDVRCKGIGRDLLKHIIQRFKDRQVYEIELEVRPDNSPAISLYKSIGFIETSIIPNYYDSDSSPAMVMRKKL